MAIVVGVLVALIAFVVPLLSFLAGDLLDPTSRLINSPMPGGGSPRRTSAPARPSVGMLRPSGARASMPPSRTSRWPRRSVRRTATARASVWAGSGGMGGMVTKP